MDYEIKKQQHSNNNKKEEELKLYTTDFKKNKVTATKKEEPDLFFEHIQKNTTKKVNLTSSEPKRNLNKDNSTTQEEYEKAYNNSVTSRGRVKPTKKSNMTTSTIKKIACTLAVVTVIAATAWSSVAIHNNIQTIKDENIVAEYYQEQGYNGVLNRETWRGIDNVYGYDHSGLARDIRSRENTDIAIFGYYQQINMSRKNNMDNIVSELTIEGTNECYKNFDDYLTRKGFVDEEGNPDVTIYKEKMTEIIKADIANQQHHIIDTVDSENNHMTR